MDRIAWDPALETGDPTVDAQHRELVETLNRLLALESEPDHSSVIAETLEQLSAYVSTHFASEQELMEQHGLPSDLMAVHLTEHRQLTDRTRQFVLEYRRGEVTSVEPLVEFLMAWLTHHVQNVDRALVDFLQRG